MLVSCQEPVLKINCIEREDALILRSAGIVSRDCRKRSTYASSSLFTFMISEETSSICFAFSGIRLTTPA